jgi:hypothetical protein
MGPLRLMKARTQMTTKPTHTPTPLGIREPFTDEEKRLNRIFITGKRTDGGQPTEDDFDFLELPYAPKGSLRREMAEYVVRAVNAHEDLVAACKEALIIADRFQADRLGIMLDKAIAKAEGSK